jgi:hypothetical protein
MRTIRSRSSSASADVTPAVIEETPVVAVPVEGAAAVAEAAEVEDPNKKLVSEIEPDDAITVAADFVTSLAEQLTRHGHMTLQDLAGLSLSMRDYKRKFPNGASDLAQHVLVSEHDAPGHCVIASESVIPADKKEEISTTTDFGGCKFLKSAADWNRDGDEHIYRLVGDTYTGALIGFEVEKEDASARGKLAEARAIWRSLGCALKSDGSLSINNGFEFVTPALPLNEPDVIAQFMQLSFMKLAADANPTHKCGGHIHVSVPDAKSKTRSDYPFQDNMMGWWPLLMSLAPRRLDGIYNYAGFEGSRLMSYADIAGRLDAISEKLITGRRDGFRGNKKNRNRQGIVTCQGVNHIEIRTFETPTSVEEMLFRANLVRVMAATPIVENDADKLLATMCSPDFYRLMRTFYSVEDLSCIYKLCAIICSCNPDEEIYTVPDSEYLSAYTDFVASGAAVTV